MNSKFKVLGIVVGLSVVLAAVSGWFDYRSNLEVIDFAKHNELQVTATLIQNDLQEQSNKAAARAAMVTALPSIKEAFRKQDRDQLVQRLQPAFLVQRDKYGVREGQFHLAPATSFLRIFDVKAGHGEDLSGFREMVLTANRKQEAQKGIEVGRRGLSIRGVDVVVDEKGPIGSFEVGISFSTVMDNLKRNSGFDAGVFVDATLMNDVATLLPKPDRERLVGTYQNVESTNWNVVRRLVDADLLAAAKETVTRVVRVDGMDYGITALPLLDFKGQRIGAIVAVKSFEKYQTLQSSGLVQAVALGALQAWLLAAAMWLLIKVYFATAGTAAPAKKE